MKNVIFLKHKFSSLYLKISTCVHSFAVKVHDTIKIFEHMMYVFTCEIQCSGEHSLFIICMMKYKFYLYLPATQYDGNKYKNYHVSTYILS
jgi:hypothetical protein